MLDCSGAVFLPAEILYNILEFLSEADLSRGCLISVLWNKLCSSDSLWKKLYLQEFRTLDVFVYNRRWKQIFIDRLEIEHEYITPEKRKSVEKNMEDFKSQVFKTKATKEDRFRFFRRDRNVAYADILKEQVSNVSNDYDKIRISLVACEQYATSYALSKDNYITLFNWAYFLHHFTKTLIKSPELSEALYQKSFSIYEEAVKIDDNLIIEDTWSRWGDCIHDYAKSKKTIAEVEKYLELSYEKYRKALCYGDSFITYDYWALTYFTHAKLWSKNNPEKSDKYFELAYEKFSMSHQLKPKDSYVLFHWASTLQCQAMLKEDYNISIKLFRAAFEKFEQADLSDDYYTIRFWADALHDCARKILFEVDNNTNLSEEDQNSLLDEAKSLLDESHQKFEEAVALKSDYTNALNNWGLSLSTKAKLLPPQKSEEFFDKAYTKFHEALNINANDTSYIYCNWAMMLISQAKKREKDGNNEGAQEALKQAREKIEYQISRGDNWGLFCMARWCAVTKKEEECKEYLLKTQQIDSSLLAKATKGQLSYFKNVEQKTWFQEILNESRKNHEDKVEFL